MKIHLVLVAVSLASTSSAAEILYENLADAQGFVDGEVAGYFNMDSTNSGGFFGPPDAWVVVDVTVSGGGWNVASLGTTYVGQDGFLTGFTQATVNIFAKTGALPRFGVDNPQSFAPVGTAVYHANHDVEIIETGSIVGSFTFASIYSAKVTGLDIDLADGDYWIGFTPFGAEGSNLPAVVAAGLDSNGDADASFSPDIFGSQWTSEITFGSPQEPHDAAFLIEGTLIPAPGVGALAILGITRLRRANRR